MASPTAVTLRIPSKYAGTPGSGAGSFSPPSLDWLNRTWTVTHSTLAMWRPARNVRITYKLLPPKPDGRPRIDDMVEYESSAKGDGPVRRVAGVDTATSASDTGVWDWRGKSWLFFVSSHWEVLGWGERPLPGGDVERWAVTWFAPTVFTKEGIDIYCDRREGLSEGTLGLVMEALKTLDSASISPMVEKDMQAVEIRLPWKES